MRRLIVWALFALAPPLAAQKADSTVCVGFRTITTATGKIATTSVTKIPCGGSVAASVDTVRLWYAPNTNAKRDSVLWAGPFVWTAGSRPADFKLPIGPGTVTRVDTVRVVVVVHDTVRVPGPPTPTAGTAELPRSTVDVTMPQIRLCGTRPTDRPTNPTDVYTGIPCPARSTPRGTPAKKKPMPPFTKPVTG